MRAGVFIFKNMVMPMSAASIRLGCLKNVCYFGRIWWLLTEYYGVLLERSLVLFFVLYGWLSYFVHFEIYPGVSILPPKPFPLSIPWNPIFKAWIYKSIRCNNL